MFDQTYKKMNRQISPSGELIRQTQTLMEAESDKDSAQPQRLARRPAAGLVAILICIAIISIPVMAATVSTFNDLLYFVAPDTAQFLRPVEISSEDKGIEMAVVAAINDDDTAVIYLTLQDLTGNRVDETLDIYDYRIRGCSAFTHDLVNYDEQTGMATICMVGSGGEHLNGRKITVKIDSFLSNKVVHADVPLDMNTLEIEEYPATMELAERNILGGAYSGNGHDAPGSGNLGTAVVLRPWIQPAAIADDIGFVSVSAVGYIDGLLHVQTMWDASIDNHGDIYFTDKNGNVRSACKSLYFVLDKDRDAAPYGTKYVEYVFEISEDELANYEAYGNFTENKCYTQGDWRVTFRIAPVGDERITRSNVHVNGSLIDKLTITPLGVRLESHEFDFENTELQLVMNTGEIIEFNFVYSIYDGNIAKVKYFPSRLIDVEQVKELSINHVMVPVR